MSKILDSSGKKQNKIEHNLDMILFRWIMLILLTVAGKVLNGKEAMNIYTSATLEGKSTIVDNFHMELLKIMGHGETNE